MTVKKFAVTPGFEVGGTLFRPEQLAVLGSIVGPDAQIEMTTFKQLYVAMDEERISEVQEQLKQVGLEVHPAGFVSKSLITCNFCRGAEDAGLDVAKRLDEAAADHKVPSPLKIGYAGCALGTSEPLLKDIAVVKMKDVFDIYIGGEPKGIKANIAQLFMKGVTEEQLLPMILRLISIFQENGKKKENYSRFVKRMTPEKLHELVSSSVEITA
ncbi:nitrite reductase [Paenibacillus sp. N3/727]|uniref:nitrite reductase n=1 Tax=Paenibacillus sp. N3/727 TaxID=2925845 RepID=UPI001F532897|nr:nitrite reductase [Paenibacillus sp. N3/727]UNK18251.1 nitrite reductase [Paenibacillus sp. N3/727]